MRSVKRAVRRVERDVGEEGFFGGGLLADEAVRLGEKHVGAKTLGGDDAAVVKITAVEVGVVPEIGRLADPAAAVIVDLGETAVLRAVGVVVAEVPLAEQAGGVAVGFEQLADGDLVFAQHGAAVDGVPHAGAVGPVTGEQGGARRRARGSNVIVLELRRLGGEAVDVRGFDDGIARETEVAVALVVGDDEDDVGLPRRRGRGCDSGEGEKDGQGERKKGAEAGHGGMGERAGADQRQSMRACLVERSTQTEAWANSRVAVRPCHFASALGGPSGRSNSA